MTRSKKRLAFVLFACAFFLFSVRAQADIVDSFGDMTIAEYQNLNAVSAASLGWSGVSDPMVLVQGTSNRSTVEYRCTGATAVSVRLYTKLPAFATLSAGGVLARTRQAGDRLALFYSPSDDLIYLRYAGSCYTGSYDLNRGEYLFADEAARLPDDAGAYGLSVWYCSDGQYQQAAATLMADAQCTGCYMQQYTAAIPAGSTAVRIVLTEQNTVPVVGRSARYPIKRTGSMALGAIAIADAQRVHDDGTGDAASAADTTPWLTSDYADTYGEYYEEPVLDESEAQAQQEYREEITARVRAQTDDSIEPLPEQSAAAQPKRRAQKTDGAADQDNVASEEAQPEQSTVSVDYGKTAWGAVDTVAAVLIAAVGLLLAVRIILRGREKR